MSDCNYYFSKQCETCALLTKLNETLCSVKTECTKNEPSEPKVKPPIPNHYENIWDFDTDIRYKKLLSSSSSTSSDWSISLISSSESSFYSDSPPPNYPSPEAYTPEAPPIYENIYPKVKNLHRFWQSTPNLANGSYCSGKETIERFSYPALSPLCSAEEVNIAFESADPICQSVLLTESKLNLLVDTVVVRKNSVTSDIVDWHFQIRRYPSSETSLNYMEERSLFPPPEDLFGSKSAASSPVQFRRPIQTWASSSQLHLPRHTSLIEASRDSVKYASADSIKPTLTIFKEGEIDRSKIIQNVRKQKKWSQKSYACLTENFFYLFTNIQTFYAMKAGDKTNRNYDEKFDLRTCQVATKSEFTKRKNIISIIDENSSSEVIFQFDDKLNTGEWFEAIRTRITALRQPSRPQTLSTSSQTIRLETANDHKHAKKKLKHFLWKRPTKNDLIKIGVWKDETIFGNNLEVLCQKQERPKVPLFVQVCIEAITPHVDTEGIYRASGNLSIIQKIRCEVDQNQYGNIDPDKVDIHVLTGALKLFFRELQVSLIPAVNYNNCMAIFEDPNSDRHYLALRHIVKTFPAAHIDTLKFLLQHLLNVASLEKENRMTTKNLATVWAPNLFQKCDDCGDIAGMKDQNINILLECTQQMKLIQLFLTHFSEIFDQL